MQTIDRIIEKLQKDSITVLRLSNETGIPAYRIYKWVSKKVKPKHEDVIKLENWLSGIANVPRVTNEQDVVQVASIKALFNEVAKIKAKVFNMDLDDCIDDLKQNTTIIIKDILKDSENKT